MLELKKFKCTIWRSIQKNACPENKACLEILATKVIEEESYEKLLEKYNMAPKGTYCLVEEIT